MSKDYLVEKNNIQIETEQNEENILEFKLVDITKTQKRKKIQKKRAKWVPFIIKSYLNPDSEPVYIFYFRKFMKSYENDEFNKYRTYGFSEAGLGRIEQIKLDKTYENLEISLDTFSFGQLQFQYLIDLYKSYQDQMYYELALVLEEYQQWSLKQNQIFCKLFSQLKKLKFDQERIDKIYKYFELDVGEWANNYFYNDIYEIVIGAFNVDKKIPVIKKKIFSKNLMMFLGGDPFSTYSQIQQLNMKESFTYLFTGDDFNGKVQLEKMIKLTKNLIQGEEQTVFQDEIITIEGIVVPTTKTCTNYYYDFETRQISQKKNLFQIIVFQYSFDTNWIKYLMDVRKKVISPPIIPLEQSQSNLESYNIKDNLIKKFDFMCQQEYFLEKYKYI